jgi:hypothetical protein
MGSRTKPDNTVPSRSGPGLILPHALGPGAVVLPQHTVLDLAWHDSVHGSWTRPDIVTDMQPWTIQCSEAEAGCFFLVTYVYTRYIYTVGSFTMFFCISLLRLVIWVTYLYTRCIYCRLLYYVFLYIIVETRHLSHLFIYTVYIL